MGTIEEVRTAIRSAIADYARLLPVRGDVEVESIHDPAKDHYELVETGWEGLDRVHRTLIHVDIRGDKVLIQQDGTEEGIANVLVGAGIPKDRIVLAFKPPDIRPYTDFAGA